MLNESGSSQRDMQSDSGRTDQEKDDEQDSDYVAN